VDLGPDVGSGSELYAFLCLQNLPGQLVHLDAASVHRSTARAKYARWTDDSRLNSVSMLYPSLEDNLLGRPMRGVVWRIGQNPNVVPVVKNLLPLDAKVFRTKGRVAYCTCTGRVNPPTWRFWCVLS